MKQRRVGIRKFCGLYGRSGTTRQNGAEISSVIRYVPNLPRNLSSIRHQHLPLPETLA